MTTTSCHNCGTQIQDANIKFCSNCGSSQVVQSNRQGTVSDGTSNMIAAKARLKGPATAIIIENGIFLVAVLFYLILSGNISIHDEAGQLLIAVLQTYCIVSIIAVAFSIYGAVQMMNSRKRGFAMASAIITMFTGAIGIGIGIWALVVLQKPEIKSAFTS